MSKDELQELKERLLAEITPLVADHVGDGADQFSLLLRIIQGGHATDDIYKKAFESAQSIKQTSDKLDALMALLDEVEVDLDRDLDRGDDEISTEALLITTPTHIPIKIVETTK